MALNTHWISIIYTDQFVHPMRSEQQTFGRKCREAEDIIKWVAAKYGAEAAFACSFGAEDMVLLDIIERVTEGGNTISAFTIDTGRLHPETYELMQLAANRYRQKIDIYFPESSGVEATVSRFGINLFYTSVEKRKMCCRVRKVEPLKRALRGKKAWITGLRREQSQERADVVPVSQDRSSNLVKVCPLAEWTDDDVWSYITRHRVPFNPLHLSGFVSIGCQPCTRAVKPGEGSRSGRWWWEEGEKECGIHTSRL